MPPPSTPEAFKHFRMYAKRDPGSEDALLRQHVPLVKRIAYHLAARLPPSVVLDDLFQAGMIGLLEAARHYDAGQGASFETYAGIRIRGAMLDELRRNDWAPKSVHRKARELTEAVRQIENQTSRDARDDEIASVLGIALDEYYKILQDVALAKCFSLDDFTIDGELHLDAAVDRTSGPAERLQAEQLRTQLVRAIANLPEREALVVTLYYDAELNLREIGEVLGVSESRISQLLNQALVRLRARLAPE